MGQLTSKESNKVKYIIAESFGNWVMYLEKKMLTEASNSKDLNKVSPSLERATTAFHVASRTSCSYQLIRRKPEMGGCWAVDKTFKTKQAFLRSTWYCKRFRPDSLWISLTLERMSQKRARQKLSHWPWCLSLQRLRISIANFFGFEAKAISTYLALHKLNLISFWETEKLYAFNFPNKLHLSSNFHV